MSYKETGSL